MPNATATRILIVDDDQGLLRITERTLLREGFGTATASSGKATIQWLARNTADLMLLDLKLQDIEAKELICHLDSIGRRVPFIIITGQGDERVAVEMMKCGALDYLVKDVDFLEFVPTVVRRVLSHLAKEKQLAVAEERARLGHTIVEQGYSAVIVITTERPEPRVLYVNPAFTRLTGFAAGEITGQSLTQLEGLIGPMPELRSALSKERPFSGERALRRKDGELRAMDCQLTSVLDPAGQRTHWVVIQRDITERKQMETQAREDAAQLARQAEKLRRSNEALERSNKELQQFAYIASHDLQTPLRNIHGFMQLLKAKYASTLDEQANDWIHRAAHSAEQMHTLIRDVLAYSRVDSNARPFQLTSMREAFDAAVAMLEGAIRESGGQVTCEELPAVHGDRSQLVQLMQNLIGNGLKYHGPKPPLVHVSARRSSDEWVFAVQDNGIGIAPKHHARIFEIFRRLHDQRDYPGTGIGLAICQRVAHRHGGRIWVESEVGQGSTFCFTVPERPLELA